MNAGHRALKAARRHLAELCARGVTRGSPEREEVLAIIVALIEKFGDPDPPPALARNQETRATATKHFQEARQILRGIPK